METTARKIRIWISLAAVAGGLACSNWVANPPRTVALGDPRVAYEAILTTLRSGGYTVVENDPQRFFIRTQAKLDGDVVGRVGFWGSVNVTSRVSHIAFQVLADGQVSIMPTGYHVRDGGALVHVRLEEEIQQIAWAIARNAQALRQQQPQQ